MSLVGNCFVLALRSEPIIASACRGNSPADVLAKLAIVEEEADETIYWLELLVEAEIVPEAQVNRFAKGNLTRSLL